MSLKRIFWFWLLSGMNLAGVYAQSLEEKLIFRNLDETMGLSNSNVLSIRRDEKGFMWFGTAYGLYRYDGSRIKAFYTERDTVSLSHNNIQKLYAGPEGIMWVKNVNGTFDLYHPETETFSRGIKSVAERYHLASDSVGMILQDGDQRYWFTHPSKGLTLLSPKLELIRHYTQFDASHALYSNRIASLGEGKNGQLWIVYQEGVLERRNAERFSVEERFVLGKETPDQLTNYELLVDSDGDAWVFDPDRNSGVYYAGRLRSQLENFTVESGRLRLNNNLVKAIEEVKPGQIWLGTDHGGINVIHKRIGKVDYLSQEGLSGPTTPKVVYALYKDSDDIVWVGSHKQGVSYYHPGLLRFAHVKTEPGNPGSLPFNDVNAFVEDSLGNLYLGTNGGGLFYYDRQKKTYRNFKHQPGNPNSIAGDIIVDLVMDHAGILWIGTYLKGLSSYDGRTFKNYAYDPAQTNGIPGPNIWKLFEDHRHQLWIGTLKSGLSILNPERTQFKNYAAGDEPYQLHNQYIASFEEDAEGNVWIGGGSGINVVRHDQEQALYFSDSPETGLRDGYVTEFFRDKKGVMWLTTVNGLHYFDAKDSVFVHYGEEAGLPSAFLLGILEDAKGNLWLSSQKGLSYVEVDRSKSPFGLSFQNFDPKDGLQASLFNKNSFLKTSDGLFLFGGPNGYNSFRSENFAFERNDPKVIFTDLQLFNEKVTVGAELNGRVILTKALADTSPLILKHNENIFTIAFSALNYLYPEKTRYRYKLSGFNDEWIYLGDDQSQVTFTNLDPGDYTLVVQPSTLMEGWSAYEYTLPIRVLAPFWKTPLAYLIYFINVLALVLFFRNRFIARQRENFAREQAILEAKRVQELDRMKTKFFTNLSHEFRTPLSLILTPTEHLISESPDSQLLPQFKIIQRNARRLLKLINQLLDVKKLERGDITFHPSEGDVVQFVRDVVADFHELSENKHIKLTFESNENSQQAIFDVDKLEKILFNLLSNAFKFTQEEGSIVVDLEILQENEDSGTLVLRVSDTGIGIASEDLKRIFDRFYTTEGHTQKLNQGSGIGLSLVQDFVKMMQGEIRVESTLGKGTTFVATIPITLIQSETWEEEIEAAQNPKHKEVILIAEDHAEFRQYLKDCLSKTYQVITASDGIQAWEMAQEHIPDLIVTDLMMPGMDGNELCKKIKNQISTSHIPVILLTAKKSEDSMLSALDTGANLYLTKPFNLDVLLLSIKNLIRERNARQEQFQKKIEINTSEVQVTSLDEQLIKKAIALVEQYLDDSQLSVEFLSRELGMSRVLLYKKLQSLTGKSPIEFIRLIRLKRAAQLLLKSDLNVSEIAYQVGYNNAKYFAKQFKAEFGVLPSEYNEQVQEKLNN